MNILVTGGASGLGAAIVENLAKSFPEHTVYFTYNSSRESALAIEKLYDNAKSIQCNFLDKGSVDSVGTFIEDIGFGVLVNNAMATFAIQHFHKVEITAFQESFQHNIIPVIALNQSFIRQARKAKFGKIITILTTAIKEPPMGWALYAAEKMYLLGLNQSWATENIKFNITANCISPGFMLTPLQHDKDEREIEAMIQSHPLKALLKVEEVAETVRFFISASQQINNQNIIINAK